MPSYDHRRFWDRVKSPIARMTGLERHGWGLSHFVFNVADIRIGYCYIRKNACSAFKRLIVDCSPYRDRYENSENAIHFLNEFHEESSVLSLERCDALVFVYRSPVERITSLFVHKFVMHYGADDILANFAKVTNIDPDEATFAKFIGMYLESNAMETLDRHAWPQISHLHRLKYTHAIPIHELASEMAKIVGKDVVTKYFGEPTNATKGIVDPTHNDLSDISCRELSAAFDTQGKLPTSQQLARPDLIRRIERLYESDVAWVQKLTRMRNESIGLS